MTDLTKSGALIGLGEFRVVTPAGLTATGQIRKFQDRTVAKLAQIARGYTEEINQGLPGFLADTYTEGSGTLADTTQARLSIIGAQGREGVQVEVVSGASHIVFLTSLAGDPSVSPGHIIPTTPHRIRFFWKNPWGGDPPGQFTFNSVFWRPHNIPAGSDPIATALSDYADRFARDMLDANQRAVVEFISENQSYADTAGYVGFPKRIVGG